MTLSEDDRVLATKYESEGPTCPHNPYKHIYIYIYIYRYVHIHIYAYV